jgi:O-acetyl-ADP-ribose deacetylase (regulator of RNase III)
VNILVLETALTSGQNLQLIHGDITSEKVDAIVNAANEYLQHGAGVAGAILRKGGLVIRQESDVWVQTHGSVSHAEPAWTSGGNLPCRYVIHAVGPVWGDGEEDAKLAAAVAGSLKIADELKLESIAMPAISTGIFGFPKERAAKVIFAAVRDYFRAHLSGLKLVKLVLYNEPAVYVFEEVWHDYFSA